MRWFFSALSILTVIPVPERLLIQNGKIWRALSFFPLAGMLQGLFAYGVFRLLMLLTGQYLVAVTAAVFFYHIMNGGLHIDGLVDYSDAFFGSKKNKERFREILKDSRIGAMGAFALVAYFGLVFSALYATKSTTMGFFLAFGMSGRMCIVICSAYSRALFNDGLGKIFADNSKFIELSTALCSYLAVSVLLGGQFVLLAGIVVVWSVLFRTYILLRWNGFSGDLLGAGCCITEILVAIFSLKILQ